MIKLTELTPATLDTACMYALATLSRLLHYGSPPPTPNGYFDVVGLPPRFLSWKSLPNTPWGSNDVMFSDFVRTADASVLTLSGTHSTFANLRPNTWVDGFLSAQLAPITGELIDFVNQANQVWVSAQAEIALTDPTLPVVILGHSLGGGVSYYVYRLFKRDYPNRPVRWVTFGSPYPALKPNSAPDPWAGSPHVRIHNQGDFIPHFPNPGSILGAQPFGIPATRLFARFFHSGLPVRLPGPEMQARYMFGGILRDRDQPQGRRFPERGIPNSVALSFLQETFPGTLIRLSQGRQWFVAHHLFCYGFRLRRALVGFDDEDLGYWDKVSDWLNRSWAGETTGVPGGYNSWEIEGFPKTRFEVVVPRGSDPTLPNNPPIDLVQEWIDTDEEQELEVFVKLSAELMRYNLLANNLAFRLAGNDFPNPPTGPNQIVEATWLGAGAKIDPFWQREFSPNIGLTNRLKIVLRWANEAPLAVNRVYGFFATSDEIPLLTFHKFQAPVDLSPGQTLEISVKLELINA